MDVSSVRLILGEGNISTRHALVSMLRHKGFHGIQYASTIDAVEDCIKSHNADLLICDNNIEGGSLCDLVEGIRHGRIGKNPFMVIIALIAKAESEVVRALVNAGVDDILVKPVSGFNLDKHLHMLAHHRKQFLVTETYFGPDRRKDKRNSGAQQIGTFMVPNPLEQGGVKVTSFQVRHQIEKTKKMINDQFIERYATEQEFLTGHVALLLHNNKQDEVPDMLAKLERVVVSLKSKLGLSDFGHAARPCSDILDMIMQVKLGKLVLSVESLVQLEKLNQTVQEIIFPPKVVQPKKPVSEEKSQEKPACQAENKVRQLQKMDAKLPESQTAVQSVSSQEELAKRFAKSS
ncbi:response regulator [Terasakiella sp. SH-1]|uniref:response regulator n=1 Tax=Terasakiella sp. SH-1 TaxID=2560057 RepID=UPI001074450B|nr:response regulator [Terasakiella sp. SH-1]